MSNLNQVLEELHEEMARDLLRRVKTGEATPAELNTARQFLKDNGIEAIPTPDNPLGELTNRLPEFDPQHDEFH